MLNTPLPPIETMNSARQHGWTSEAALDQALEALEHERAKHVFTRTSEASARLAAQTSDRAHTLGIECGPLSGVLVSIKDLYDVAGEVTLAGTRVFASAKPATQDAPAVARLRAAGAVILGKTNMTELAFSGIGINPHYGTPVNPADERVARIPGGSSSGAAVSVALGLASVGLGSDTGGSIRIPAAWCGLVGFKSTQNRVPIQGAVSLSHTLDTVCAMARTVADIRVVDAVLSQQNLPQRRPSIKGLRLAVVQNLVLDQMDQQVQADYVHALQRLAKAGAQLMEVQIPEFNEIADIHAPAGFSAIECWASHKALLQNGMSQLDPRVASRLRLGIEVSAADYLTMKQRRADWIARTRARLQAFDAWCCPTVPVVAPEIASLLDDDAAFMATNRLSLRNTFVSNFLDGCSISLPMHAPGQLPTGFMLSSVGGDDARLLDVAQLVESVLQA
jgi:aspartyl-tRNA(Asn)/glutamyl-tRNA(Gln) amidotransferase subunit A